MNYFSSFLNWSNEPAQNNATYAEQHNNNTHHEPQYVSPLSALTKLEPFDDNDSQPSSLASALFYGWGSSSSSQPSHKHKAQRKQSNVSLTPPNPYVSHRPYNLPSVTQYQQPVILPPPSHPSAPVSVTASPPPPMMANNELTYTHTTKKRSNSIKNQIKFTPKYKKKHSQTYNDAPLVLPSHSVSQRPSNPNLDTITESMPITPKKEHTKRNKFSLIDALQYQVDDREEHSADKRHVDTPPPRAPIQPFTYIEPDDFNEMEFENDIVRPHDGYNQIKSPPFQYQSVTESVKSADEIADETNTKDAHHLMVSVLSEYDSNYGDNAPRTPPIFVEINKQHSGHHLAPIERALPHLEDGDEDDETNEVNLHYNKDATLNSLYGVGMEGELDTNSVVSDFDEAGVLLNKSSKKQNKIHVTCNNCYLWRHLTNKLQIDVDNLRQRTKALEQNINVAEDNVQFQTRYYDELAEDNERLKEKNNELKNEITKQKHEATDALISARKTKETETKLINKDCQSLMKQRNELELSYNEMVNISNDKDAEMEKYKNEVHSMQLKYDRLNYGIIEERYALNIREKEIKQNLDEIREKYLNLQKEHNSRLDEINTLSEDNSKYKLRIKQLKEEFPQKVENELDEKHQRMMVDINKYKEKNDVLSISLQKSENECIELKSKLSIIISENEVKLMEIGLKLNNLEDELTSSKDENGRLMSMKDKLDKQLMEREEQLKQWNQENDKLMDQNYELDEKLSKSIEQIDDYKNSLYSLKNDKTDYNEKLEILSAKLAKATASIEKQSKKNVRLHTQVESLQNENKGLQNSIHHLESVIDDTYGLAEDKERMLNHLKRKNNENQLNLDNLKKRIKKHQRQKTSYRQIEDDKLSKSHRKMDQKLDNLRKSNMMLHTRNDELNQTIKELNRDINELKSQLTEIKTKSKSTQSKYESDISQITANNNKIMSDQINLEAELDQIKEENDRLIAEVNGLKRKYDVITQKYNMMTQKVSYHVDTRQYLIELDIGNDELYQFTNRCRNIFMNTNRLTPKLIMQLIESCHRSIVLFHQSKSKFNHFITKCDSIHERFINLQQTIIKKYTKTGSIIPIASSNSKTRRSSDITKLKTASSSWGDLKSEHKKKSIIKKNKIKIYKNIIRRPIQEIKPPHLQAYNEIYLLSFKNLTNAKNDILDIAQLYTKPLDYTCYEYQNDDDDDDVPWIDWDRLSIDASSERYKVEEMMKNNERFIATIKKLKTTTKELRTLHAKTGVELNVAWHSYYLSPNININENKNDNDNKEEIDDYTGEYDMHSDLDMDSEYFDFMKKVNTSGPQQKRFSII